MRIGVSFVSVTQAFNTTTSMGRLTLNVLLSFAQFEREVTGERIRDKIAASKRRACGWAAMCRFGYRVENRRLVIDPEEATVVRQIFTRYLVLGSLPALQREMRQQGIRTRLRPRASGGTRGDTPFTNGPLSHLLRNRVYRGEINHRGKSHPGDHDTIIDEELFQAVQERLTANHHAKKLRTPSDAILMGKLVDDRGNAMSPSHARKNGARYRYYISCVLAQGRKAEAGSIARVSAPEIEAAVISALRDVVTIDDEMEPLSDLALADMHLIRVTISSDSLEIAYRHSADGSEIRTRVAWSPRRVVRRREVMAPAPTSPSETSMVALHPIRAEARARLLEGVAKGRAWLDDLVTGRVTAIEDIAAKEGVTERSIRMTLNLAFLNPVLVKAAVEGTLPRGTGLSRLTDPPLDWQEQMTAMLGS